MSATAATTDAAAPADGVDLDGAASWEVSDDAPLAATSAAYAATKAAVAEPSAARTFPTPPGKGVERATIRSRLVRFNAEPDDIRSAELGRLDRGDEVEIVGSFEGFLNVRVPDGTTGWIHRAALI
ncbi:MAG TPA: SH3 domain-containing protein [Candidatus Limnocylindrales bacterium]|nr:SH3 domain-containing protein [Candidatus Limnocylindrales bacterium]